MNVSPTVGPEGRRSWDRAAIGAGAIVTVVVSVPAWVAASWALSAGRWTLTAAFSSIEFLGFVLGAACAAWAQRSSMPLAHGIVTSIGTYLGLQVILAVVRLVSGSGVDLMNAIFFATLAAVAGIIGAGLGQYLGRRIPSRARHSGAGDGSGPR